MTSLEYARKNKDYIVELRRHFHKYPELSWEEFGTTKKICEELDKLGIEYITPSKTGVLAAVKGAEGKPVIGFRCDIDALPVNEESEKEYASQNKGVMHACGHDGHIAVMLGLAKYISENRENMPTVKLIFQPAEERLKGAERLIESDVDFFEDIECFYGIHLWSGLQTGKISVEEGPRMAAADFFDITINGKSGHGATPHQAIDAVYVAANIIISLQSIVSRICDPMEPVVLSVGAVNGGDAHNIIAGSVTLKGTTRYFLPSYGKELPELIERYVKNICDIFGAQYTMKYTHGTKPVINDEGASKVAGKCVENALGEGGLASFEKIMCGEDFSEYIQNRPGCFAFVGAGYGGCYEHHNEKFDIDEDSLVYGAAYFVEVLRAY